MRFGSGECGVCEIWVSVCVGGGDLDQVIVFNVGYSDQVSFVCEIDLDQVNMYYVGDLN